jgi:hypothetical protein
MMMFLVLLAWLAGMASLVSYIWLTVLAFKRSVGWGLAVLFIPFAFIVFAVKYWTEAKVPFLVNLGSGVAGVAIFFAIGGAMLGMMMQMTPEEMSAEDAANFIESTMDEMEQSGTLDANEQQELDRMRSMLHDMQGEVAGGTQPSTTPGSTPIQLRDATDGSSTLTLPQGVSKSTSQLPEDLLSRHRRSPSSKADGAISTSEAEDYIGLLMRIQGKNLDTFGRLTKVESDRLTFERRLISGLVHFELSERDIETLTIIER